MQIKRKEFSSTMKKTKCILKRRTRTHKVSRASKGVIPTSADGTMFGKKDVMTEWCHLLTWQNNSVLQALKKGLRGATTKKDSQSTRRPVGHKKKEDNSAPTFMDVTSPNNE